MPPPLTIPPFVTITDVAEDARADAFVISNEATGRHFSVNRATVDLLDAVRRCGDPARALTELGLTEEEGKPILSELFRAGVITAPGVTHAQEPARGGPIEGRAISMRFDLLDASGPAARIGGLGRLLFHPAAYAFWALAIAHALFLVADNSDKARLMLAALPQTGALELSLFAAMFVMLKCVHEMGHALAYRTFCLREGLAPGPIRMGICIFAMTPFPFTDVSGAWRLRSRGRRAMIGLAGIYVETWIIAGLTVVWAHTGPGVVQTVILQVAMVSGLLTLVFNLNPAVRLDGYYVLTDLIREPNLATRATRAARNVGARLLGASAPVPRRIEIGYWLVSYAYRWVIFSGIFWLAYRFDRRLAVPVLIVIGMLLIVRPLVATIRHARRSGARLRRGALGGAVLAGIAALFFVPLPAWILAEGRLVQQETSYLYAPETARLTALPEEVGGRVVLENPELAQQSADLDLRREAIAIAARGLRSSGAQQAALENDLKTFAEMRAEMDGRLAALEVSGRPDEVWTPLAGAALAGSWVDAAERVALGAFSRPVVPHLKLWLDQARLESLRLGLDGQPLRARMVHAPRCIVLARIGPARTQTRLDNAALSLVADVETLPGCAAGLANGTALVARIDTAPRSIAQRLYIGASRLLQDRLPVRTQTQ